MGIKPNFTAADIQKKFDALLGFIEDETVRTLQAIGEKAVAYARSIPPPDMGGRGFKDRTANLRSSIGYAVYQDGRQLTSSYEGTAEGTSEGERLADSVGGSTEGTALVVTAGMYYAVYVESKGRDVLTSAEQRAGEWLQVELEDIQKAVIEYWNS
jgi:hypothetical protein